MPPDTYRTFLAALNAASDLTLPIPARSPLESMSREELEGRIRGMGLRLEDLIVVAPVRCSVLINIEEPRPSVVKIVAGIGAGQRCAPLPAQQGADDVAVAG